MQLGPREQKIVSERFQQMVAPVRLVMFTQEIECEYCRDTRELVEQLASLSGGKVTAEVFNFQLDKHKADEYGVDKIPAIAVIGAKDYGIRFYGIPAGYEFGALLDDILDVSKGDSGLSAKSRAALAELKEDIHLQVLTTPT
jgi:glutaredoxin-like protein